MEYVLKLVVMSLLAEASIRFLNTDNNSICTFSTRTPALDGDSGRQSLGAVLARRHRLRPRLPQVWSLKQIHPL